MKSQKKKKNSILHSYQEMNQLSPPFKIKEVVIHEASHLVVSIVLVAGSWRWYAATSIKMEQI